MSRRYVSLEPEQTQELEEALRHHEKPYIRERCAAILKVAQGTSMRQVAESGLLRRRTEEAVSTWIDRFLAGGVNGLLVQKGRGRKSAFSP